MLRNFCRKRGFLVKPRLGGGRSSLTRGLGDLGFKIERGEKKRSVISRDGKENDFPTALDQTGKLRSELTPRISPDDRARNIHASSERLCHQYAEFVAFVARIWKFGRERIRGPGGKSWRVSRIVLLILRTLRTNVQAWL